jgi:hypothetical protein
VCYTFEVVSIARVSYIVMLVFNKDIHLSWGKRERHLNFYIYSECFSPTFIDIFVGFLARKQTRKTTNE